MRLIIILLAISLAACGGIPTHDVQVVNKAVTVSCVDKPVDTPRFHTDAELKAMRDYEAIITLLSERIQREIYEQQLAVALEACK